MRAEPPTMCAYPSVISREHNSSVNDDRGFRALLSLGALVSVAIGVWGLVWAQMLSNVLGIKAPPSSWGMARLFGAAMVALAVGYALAAYEPHRTRGLLVPLFIVPVAMGVVMVVNIAKGDVDHSVRATVFAVYNFAFSLLYFRTYPRIDVPPKPALPSEPPKT